MGGGGERISLLYCICKPYLWDKVGKTSAPVDLMRTNPSGEGHGMENEQRL